MGIRSPVYLHFTRIDIDKIDIGSVCPSGYLFLRLRAASLFLQIWWWECTRSPALSGFAARREKRGRQREKKIFCRASPVSCLQSRAWSFAFLGRFAGRTKKRERLLVVYLFLHVPRTVVVGGGVALLFNESLYNHNHIQSMDAQFRDFQALEVLWSMDRRITHYLIWLFFE